MVETAPECVAAQRVLPDSLRDWGGGRRIPCAHERYREYQCLPKRTITLDLRRLDRKAPYQPSVGIDRSSSERHRGDLFNAALSDRSHHMVAGSEELASQSNRQLESALCADLLGPAQRTRILVFLLSSGVGNFRDLFFFPTTF